MEPSSPARIERRTAIKWMMTAAASLTAMDRLASAAPSAPARAARGYGPDPDIVKTYHPGDLWPLTFTADQRRLAATLCDLMIPADATSPSASAVGVPDFIDEWMSSPYPEQAPDRKIILDGLAWIDAEAQSRFGAGFSELIVSQQHAILDDICNAGAAKPAHKPAVAFFKRYRDLTAGGYYTTPEGMKAIGYVGNVPLSSYDGPPDEVLRHIGLLP